jgi:hypothetical protein
MKLERFRPRPGESEFAFVYRRLSALGAPIRFVLLILVGLVSVVRCMLVRCTQTARRPRVLLLPAPDPARTGGASSAAEA